MNGYEIICKTAQDYTPTMIALRRDFHKHAETGWFEMRTSSLIARQLKDLGYEVLTGRDGQEALEIASSQQVDLIILDVMMPEVDGFTVAKRIRESKNKRINNILF